MDRFFLLFALGLQLACQQTPDTPLKMQHRPRPEKKVILDSLQHPWSIAFLNEQEVLITEKDGGLLFVNLASKAKIEIRGLPTDLIDSIRIKDRRDNSGLFDVVLDPNFEQNKWIYLSYAAENDIGSTTKVVRAKLESNRLSNTQKLLIAVPYSQDLFHYGGGLHFGADGKLYCLIGERLYDEIHEPSIPIAQDPKDARGKIYRINPDGSIPEDNPDFGPDAIPGLYALGIRAAQGITLNKETGELWFTEHGSRQGDELNSLQAGANYGWPIKTTGGYRNQNYSPPTREGITFTAPVHYWLQTIAPTGLVFYSGTEFPQWQGDLIVAGLSRGSLWRLHLEKEEVISVEELFVNDRVRSRKVALSPEGKLFMLTDEANGKLIQIQNTTNYN